MQDLDSQLNELTAGKIEVDLRIAALDNMLLLDKAPVDQNKITQLRRQYLDLTDLYANWIAQVQRAKDLNYSTLPTLEVDPEMKATLDREEQETHVGNSLFYTTPPAVKANVSFSSPHKKLV